jgi:hypothetical protein
MLSPRNEWMQYTLAFLLGCIIKVIYIYIYRRVGIEHVAVLAILCAHGFTIINFSAQNTNYLQVSSCHPIKRNDNNTREITLNVTGTSGHNCSRSADLSWVAHSFKHPANHSSTQRSKRHRGSPALRVLQASLMAWVAWVGQGDKSNACWTTASPKKIRGNYNSSLTWNTVKYGYTGKIPLTSHYLKLILYQWEFQDPKMEVLYHIRAYFVGIFPYIGLI